MITKEQLQAWREAEQKASVGPWEEDDWKIKTVALVDPDYPKRGKEIVGEVLNVDNRAFVVIAREAVPALLDEVEQLRAKVEELEDRLDNAWIDYAGDDA